LRDRYQKLLVSALGARWGLVEYFVLRLCDAGEQDLGDRIDIDERRELRRVEGA
jgi:hypothetical protein